MFRKKIPQLLKTPTRTFKDNFSFFDCSIHRDSDSRIDKYRAHLPSATSLYPATLQDGGDPIQAVAKITVTSSEDVVRRLTRCAEIHRSLHDHRCVLKVLGITQREDRFILLLDKAEGSLRDVINPTTPETEMLRDDVLKFMNPRDIFREILHGAGWLTSTPRRMTSMTRSLTGI